MKKQIYILLLSLLLSLSFCLEPNEEQSETIYIVFNKEDIKVPDNGPTINGKAVVIEKPGKYLVSGESNEGYIVIKSSSVELLLQNLYLSSSINSPVVVVGKLQDIKITILKNSTLIDLEDPDTTEGECAVIKVLKKSTVYFQNNDFLTLNGDCKNIIKGGSQSSIIFEKSDGEYYINGNSTAISSDGLLQFNGGYFNIISEYGDGIKSLPDKDDSNSLGKILIYDGTFKIHTFGDAFTAKNNITIVKGKFEITTENGYESTTIDENASSKGFKLNNNETGCGIKIYKGEFIMNTADDAFHSKGDIIILSGKYEIYSKDDGISAKHDLILGIKDAPKENLDIRILTSYEALEGMGITIYSGKIIVTATDDGINSSGTHVERGGRRNRSDIPSWIWNETEREQRRNRSSRNHTHGGGGQHRQRGNSSFYVSIYDAEIYIYCDGDGIDSNGNIFIHGGNINVFSQGNRDNEPIDHDGNFTLFNGEVLGVGSKGIEYIHEGIKKGNQMYAYYAGAITKNKLLEILNEKDELVKEGRITKDINYIFYSSPKLNNNYHFYITDDDSNVKSSLNVTFNMPENGDDSEDNNYNEDNNNKEDNKNEENKTNSSNYIKLSIIGIILLILS